MTRFALTLATFAILALLPATTAEALNTKSWVSNAGSDADDCALAHPCATLQRAHDQTNPGGEVGVLTPGDYGGLSGLDISKAIGITNDGSGEATMAGHVAIQVHAGVGDVVS